MGTVLLLVQYPERILLIAAFRNVARDRFVFGNLSRGGSSFENGGALDAVDRLPALPARSLVSAAIASTQQRCLQKVEDVRYECIADVCEQFLLGVVCYDASVLQLRQMAMNHDCLDVVVVSVGGTRKVGYYNR